MNDHKTFGSSFSSASFNYLNVSQNLEMGVKHALASCRYRDDTQPVCAISDPKIYTPVPGTFRISFRQLCWEPFEQCGTPCPIWQ